MKILLLIFRYFIRLSSKRRYYYILIDEFDRILLADNPCQFINNQCIYNRQKTHYESYGCCNKCDKLCFSGCTIQSLGCKAHLCLLAFNNLSDENKKEWRELQEMSKYFYNTKPKE